MKKVKFITKNTLTGEEGTRMTITNDGKIGIGTETPGKVLDVSGDIHFTGTLFQNGQAFTSGADLATSSISELADVNLTGIATNQGVKWDGTKLVPTSLSTGGEGGGGFTDLTTFSISDLSNVNLSGISAGQGVQWDGTKLVPANATTKMGSIVPLAHNTYSLGTPTNVWKDVYIGPGSLYIDGQKVIESDSNTIIMGADDNQNLKINGTGTGQIQIETESNNISIQTIGSGDVVLGSTGTGTVKITKNISLLDGVEIQNIGGTHVTVNDNLNVTGTILTDNITERTNAHGVVIDGVTLKNGSITAGSNSTISASNFNVGSKNVVSASAQGSFTDLEVKNLGNTGFLVFGETGDAQLTGTLQVDDIGEKTSAHGVVVGGVTLKNGSVTAGSNSTISASNFNVGSKNVVSASAQGSFTDLEVKNLGNTGFLVFGETGDAQLTGTLQVDDIGEKTSAHGVVIDGVTIKDGDISANSLTVNGVQVTGGGGGGNSGPTISGRSIINVANVLLNDGYEVTASVNEEKGQSHSHHNATSVFYGPQYGEHCWSANTSNKYYGDNGNGLYTGSTSTTVGGSSINGEWIQINFNKKVTVYYSIVNSHPGRSPKDYTIVGSNDGTNWTLVHEQNGTSDVYSDYDYRQTWWSNNISRIWQKNTFSTAVTYQYLRLIVENQYPNTDQYLWIEDILYFGYFPEDGHAVTLQNSSISDLSNVSITAPSDGQALVWNDASGVWQPGNVAASGGSSSINYYSGEVKNISDVGLYGGYTITDSEDTTHQYNPMQAFTFESYNPNWTGAYSVSNKYNTTTGVYTGSSSTNGVLGVWLQIDFGKQVNVHYYQIRGQGEQGVELWNAPKEFTLFGSDDGNSWTNLGSDTKTIQDYNGTGDNGNGYPLSKAKYVQTTLSSPATFRYFRLVITKNFGNNSLYSEFYNGGTNGNLMIHYLGYYGTFNEPIGVGNSNPNYTLDISGDINFTGNLYQNGVLFNGGGGGSGTTTVTKQGQVLETLTGVCDGRTVVVESGSYTLPNVTGGQFFDAGTDWQDINGGNISYKPPSGTKQVIFKFHINISGYEYNNYNNSNSYIASFKAFLDATELNFKFVESHHGGSTDGLATLTLVFDIGSEDDVANGKLSSWDSNKVIKFQGKAWSFEPRSFSLHVVGIFGSTDYHTNASPPLAQPKIEIVSIGEETTTSGGGGGTTIDSTTDISVNHLDVSSNLTVDGRIAIGKDILSGQNATQSDGNEYDITFHSYQNYNNWVLFNTSNNNGGWIPQGSDFTIEYEHKMTRGSDANYAHFGVFFEGTELTTSDFSDASFFMYYSTNWDDAVTLRYWAGKDGTTAKYKETATSSSPLVTLNYLTQNYVNIKYEYIASTDTVKLYFNGALAGNIIWSDAFATKPYGKWGFGEWNKNTHHIRNPRITISNSTHTLTSVHSRSNTQPTISGPTSTGDSFSYSPPTLDVSGNGIFSGTVQASGNVLSSDDRLKHNETIPTTPLNTIMKMTPKHYFKTRTMYDVSHNFTVDASGYPVDFSNNRLVEGKDYTRETGIIAQDLQAIPELNYIVKVNGVNEPLGVDYNSIHCTHIAATKELHSMVKSQQTIIDDHVKKINALTGLYAVQKQKTENLENQLAAIKQHLGI